MQRRIIAFAAALFSSAAVPAHSALWIVGPDPCPAPAAYSPEAWLVSPDAREGVRPGGRAAPEFWPPSALTAEIPGGAWRGGGIFAWFDGDVFAAMAQTETTPPGCAAFGAAPQ